MVSKKEADAYVISLLNPEFFYILLHRIRFKESIKNLLCNQPKPTSKNTQRHESQFFGKVVLLPPRIESSLWLKLFRKLLYRRPRRSYRHSIISTLTILQSASCFQHFFVVKYNPVSQLKFMLLFIESIGPCFLSTL